MRTDMDPKAIELLEFKKVQEMLAREAGTSLGRAKALELIDRKSVV